MTTRRWLQFNLKSLLILVLFVALPFSWLAWKMDRKRRERAAVSEIKKLGGWVTYKGNPFKSRELPGPRWLRKLFGDDFFTHVYSVELHKSTNGDSALEHVKELTGLEILDMEDCSMTGRSFDSIALLTSLEALSLSGCDVTDASIVNLKTMVGLKQLRLFRTSMTDGAVAYLEKFQGLEELVVGPIGPPGMSRAGFERLEASLPHCDVIEVDLEDLGYDVLSEPANAE